MENTKKIVTLNDLRNLVKLLDEVFGDEDPTIRLAVNRHFADMYSCMFDKEHKEILFIDDVSIGKGE